MEILASCSYTDRGKYTGKLVVEDPDGGKPINVRLNLVIGSDDEVTDEVLSSNVKCVTVVGNQSTQGLEKLGVDVFHEITLEDVDSLVESEKVIPLVRLADRYCDMRKIWELSQANSSVRFIGGNLLGIDGVKIGRYDAGKEKMSPVFNGVYDSFIEADISELDNLTERIKKVSACSAEGAEKKQKTPKEKKAKAPAKKKANLATSFSSLFNGDEEVEF